MTREEILQIAKPILFNTDMVRAILDGRKGVTRRICKDGNDFTVPDMSFYDADKRTYAVHNYADKGHTDKLSIAERTCPICPGDYLYVRETWQYIGFTGEDNGYVYKVSQNGKDWEENTDDWIWRPSIHMPKEAARIFLRVTDVQVERLQSIWASDVSKEGILFTKPYTADEMIVEFRKLWDSTISKKDLDKYGWNANPWVWVIKFERVDV